MKPGGACLLFEDCTRDREWSDPEKDCLRAVADMFGATIARRRAQQALLDANEKPGAAGPHTHQ